MSVRCREKFGEDAYFQYLRAIPAEKTHAGYFSVDKKGRMTNSKLSDRKAKTSDDADAYDLIMKNKELLLDLDPKRSPVRFIFSHSALREGWDNPNVFQICTLKQSSSEVRKRQEVGRGLRLCVNQAGERMDANLLGDEVQDINVLTVVASESYESFAKGLQHEIAEAVPIARALSMRICSRTNCCAPPQANRLRWTRQWPNCNRLWPDQAGLYRQPRDIDGKILHRTPERQPSICTGSGRVRGQRPARF